MDEKSPLRQSEGFLTIYLSTFNIPFFFPEKKGLQSPNYFDYAEAAQSLIPTQADCVSPSFFPAFVKLPHSTTIRNTLYWNVISVLTSQAHIRSWQNLLLDISLIFRFKCCSII